MCWVKANNAKAKKMPHVDPLIMLFTGQLNTLEEKLYLPPSAYMNSASLLPREHVRFWCVCRQVKMYVHAITGRI